ncbi:hypothetical protein BCR32DRAFT_284027 [Anaeromyces robustus]|uniref:Uncharacterized protein n=1 Tax=Anaeromyces robustus TaxID=1754192 RepID=A0A1Y1WSP9_9FUNG|nr:hypothetical protein BCR32DRAFT_284027 [Anaeromyces robustus]|eukprot:ORX76569.1 hypothetical protein BCR32DRAFT_284027 [Anaeromyces robustus]
MIELGILKRINYKLLVKATTKKTSKIIDNLINRLTLVSHLNSGFISDFTLRPCLEPKLRSFKVGKMFCVFVFGNKFVIILLLH